MARKERDFIRRKRAGNRLIVSECFVSLSGFRVWISVSICSMVCGKQSWVFLAIGARCRKKFLPHIPIMHQSNMMSPLSNVSERLL